MLSMLPKQAQWAFFAASVLFTITVVAGLVAILVKW